MSELHVVFGATGGLGAVIVRHLAVAGRPVRAAVRNPDRCRDTLPAGVELAAADALDGDAVRRVCRGASVVYHCVNVPYSRWTQVMPAATANVLLGAASAQARLVFPGNVYGYGRFQQTPASEEHPLAATSQKGRLRNELERRLLDAHRSGDCPVVIPRMPDYFGPHVTNALFAPMFETALKGRRAYWPGRLDMPHDLIFTPDAAAACVLLGETQAAFGQVWHVPGAGPVTGGEFLRLIFTVAGTRSRATAMSRPLFRLAGLFVPDAREMVDA